MKLNRKIEENLLNWKNSKLGLLVYGSRQVGKTYILNDFITNNFDSHYYLNLYQNVDAIEVLLKSRDVDDFILRLSTLSKDEIKDGGCIFIDEIQEFYTYIHNNKITKYFDPITACKFIVEQGKYRIIYSGSLLRLELNDVISNPVGYLLPIQMYPLDFEEFLLASKVNQEIINVAKDCFNNRKEIPDYIHSLLSDLFNKYLLVGGMPQAVSEFFDKNSFVAVEQAHKAIDHFIRLDITKYAEDNEKLKIKEIYNLIPTELNNPSKRYIISHIPNHLKNQNEQLSFSWLVNAGVCIEVNIVNEPIIPLKASSVRNKFKIFHEDVGLLTYLLMDADTKKRLINGDLNINYGAICENVCAQLLYCHGFDNLYYYNNKKFGEIDFLIERNAKVLPIEIKSGKDYLRHSALNNLLNIKNYSINEAYVFYEGNIVKDNNITYFPMYCIEFVVNRHIV